IDIPTEHFSHKAFYNQEQHRVEMHLVCKKAHEWRIGNRSFAFRRNETLHTENSYKYTPEGFRQLARASGLFPRALWTDEKNWFALHLLETAPFVHAVT
ncbi:MAG: L-histidine N(alpha)-methyltransferase, partial [Alphaproteobacteria bacterium]|nr:L-histidine N(alpha)-methyltransferase [Alphaproteobacteria bacterium]